MAIRRKAASAQPVRACPFVKRPPDCCRNPPGKIHIPANQGEIPVAFLS
jgi:hypothetical protein